MCGIFGIATTADRRVGITDAAATRLRDLLAHRGPDGAGLWRSPAGNVLLAHRRLSVIDPTPAGAQPMLAPARDAPAGAPPRFALVYNGELYNDADVRRQLEAEATAAGAGAAGVRFRTRCDTETVLRALLTWGPDALHRLRGMYALAFYDAREQSLLLARDPLGVKPLYYRFDDADSPTVIFASEPEPILAHPDVPRRPDPVTISAYLTTIRTTLGSRTLFEGVRTLRPGEHLRIDFRAGARPPRARAAAHWQGPPIDDHTPDAAARAGVRETVTESVRLHLRADVPTCALLSGGLDSSILASLAARIGRDHAGRGLNTYCSGHADPGQSGADTCDLGFARRMAAHLGSSHTEAPITRELFALRWPDMVRRTGLPLSTPNEVAINEVARVLASRGHVVALSGEGADELFGGYQHPMCEAWDFESAPAAEHPGDFQLRSAAWVPSAGKAAVLSPDAWRAAEHDAALRAHYHEEFDALAAECGCAPGGSASRDVRVSAHLRFHRRVNLAGLLARLDTATMLESVEGRTPFADAHVATVAERLPLAHKFRRHPDGSLATKAVLRDAFSPDVPPEITRRPKASFPLPFQEWVADLAPALASSGFARATFSRAAVDTVVADPAKVWNLSWPMINLSLWADRWGF